MANLSENDLVDLTKTDAFKADLSKVNRWDLLPALFRVKGKPFDLVGREQFSVLFSDEMVRETIIMSGRQLGKCGIKTKKDDFLAIRDSKGLRHDTENELEDLSDVASEQMSRNRAGKVSVHMEPGVKPILRITTEMGRTLQVTKEHKVRVFDGYKEAGSLSVGSRIMALRKCYEFGDSEESEYRIALTAYFIGDGHCGDGDGVGNFEITAKKSVEDHIRRLCSEDEYRISNAYKSSKVVRARFKSFSQIVGHLRYDGLAGLYSYEKFIPDWVFDLNRECTKQFIECLWATDGGIKQDKNGFAQIDYTSTSPLLASDLRALLSKFGIATSQRIKKSGYKDKDGVYHRCHDAYIIRIWGFQSQKLFLNTFNVPGKSGFDIHLSSDGQDDRSNRDTLPEEGLHLIADLARYLEDPKHPGKMLRGKSLQSLYKKMGGEIRRTPKYPISRFKLKKYLDGFKELGLDDKPEYAKLVEFYESDVIYDRVESIEEIGEHPTFDLEIDTYHNFILDNICVHNSMSLSRSEIFNLLSIPNFQILYIAPLQEQARIYSDLYVNETIQSCPLALKLQSSELAGVLSDAKIIRSTGHQSFANGAGIQMTYAKFSADRIRGRTSDACDFDEVQDQSSDVIPIIQEAMTSSPYGCSRYTGTAKVVENLIELKWQKSSMCEWVMKCSHCGYYNIPNLDGNVLQMIQADGMHCLHCGGKLNVREGQWVAAYPDRMRTFRGYHIPQVVCPFIVENRNNWDKLLHKLMNGVLATFIQENLGISYSVGQRLLTRHHIQQQCMLPSVKTLQDEVRNNPARYSYTVAGIDWGGAELSSFTVITVIGIRPNGRIDVLWAKRYRGYDPDEQMTDIAQIVRFYGCTVCLSEDSLILTKTPLTSPCYKRIIDVATTDWVWDGSEWVQHEGVKLMKYVRKDELVKIGSTNLTGDHKVYVNDSESRRADALQGEGCASAMAWRRAASPVSAWYDVWLLTLALGRACAKLIRAAVWKERGKDAH